MKNNIWGDLLVAGALTVGVVALVLLVTYSERPQPKLARPKKPTHVAYAN